MYTNESHDHLTSVIIDAFKSLFTSRFASLNSGEFSEVSFFNGLIFMEPDASQEYLSEFSANLKKGFSSFNAALNFKFIGFELINISLSKERNIEYFFDIDVPFAEHIYESPNHLYIKSKYSFKEGLLISQESLVNIDAYEDDYKKMFIEKISKEHTRS